MMGKWIIGFTMSLDSFINDKNGVWSVLCSGKPDVSIRGLQAGRMESRLVNRASVRKRMLREQKHYEEEN
jgi:hypothetical protein